MPCFEAVHGTLCVACDAQYIIYTSKLALRVKYEGIFIQQTCEVYRLISLISQMQSQNSEEQQQGTGCSW